MKISKELEEKILLNLEPTKEIFVGVIKNKVVHISFINYNYPIGVIFFGGFTLPDFRGKHINPAVKSAIFRELRNKGIKKVYISCSRDNLSSKKSILRAGFRKLSLWQRIIIKIRIWIRKTRFIIFI